MASTPQEGEKCIMGKVGNSSRVQGQLTTSLPVWTMAGMWWANQTANHRPDTQQETDRKSKREEPQEKEVEPPAATGGGSKVTHIYTHGCVWKPEMMIM